MTVPYEFINLPNDIVYIRWYRFPTKPEAIKFVDDIQKALDETDHKIYFISDLRKGYITDVRLVHKLGGQTTHKNWGGGTAFGGNPVTGVFLGMFERAADRTMTTGTLPSPQEALEYLEGVKTGLTSGIDWEALFNVFVEKHPNPDPSPVEQH